MAACGLVATIALGLAGYVLNASANSKAERAVLREKIEQLQTMNERDNAQDERLRKIEETGRKFWRLHGWARDQVNFLRDKVDLEPSPWPVLSIE